MKPLTIAVDFDGTLCEHRYPDIGTPHEALIRSLIDIRKQGHKLILWTCREGELLEAAVQWCHFQGLDFDAVNENLVEAIQATGANPRKVFADVYLDDRGMPPAGMPSWLTSGLEVTLKGDWWKVIEDE